MKNMKSQIWSQNALILMQKSLSSTASNRMFILWPNMTSQETGSCEAAGLHNSCQGQSCRKSFDHFFLFKGGKVRTGRQNSSSKDPNTLLIINTRGHYSVLILLLCPWLLNPLYFLYLSEWFISVFNRCLHFFLNSVGVAYDSITGFSYIYIHLPGHCIQFYTFHNYLNSGLDHCASIYDVWALSRYTLAVSN